jgi:hypothetical protein
MVGYLYMPGSPFYGGGTSGLSNGVVSRNGSTLLAGTSGSPASPVRAGYNAGSGSGSGLSSGAGSTSRSSGVFSGVGASSGHSSAGHK